MKLLRICRIRNASPMCAPATVSSTVQLSQSPLAEAVWKNVCTAASAMGRTMNGEGASSSLPASILEKSRMSPMIWSSTWAELWAVETMLRCSASRGVWAKTSNIPVTPIIGVRISWLIAATNVDLARFGSSAAMRASSASRSARSRRSTSDWTAVAMLLKAPASSSSSDTAAT